MKRSLQRLSGTQAVTATYILLSLALAAALAVAVFSRDGRLPGIAACMLICAGIAVLRLWIHPRLVQHDLALKTLLAARPQRSEGQTCTDSAPLGVLIDEVMQQVRENYLEILSRNQNSLMVLQNQINPHFLYNTLDCIRGEAMESGMDDIANMVEALSSFFRYSISSGDVLVQLRDELHNTDIYHQIQQYRFRDRIKLDIECEDERALDCYLPKLTLQPIVENCILHGLEMRESNGLIAIHVELTDKRVIITVSDNGCGMSANGVDMLRQKLESGHDLDGERGMVRHGIALRNINQQLKLIFGPEYGLSVSSQLGVGTEMEIQIPAVFSRRACRTGGST